MKMDPVFLPATAPPAMNNLARAYHAAGRRDEALPLFEETLKLSKAKLAEIAHPEQVVLLFESSIGAPNANDDGKSWVPRHNGTGAVLYADGHVAMVKQKPDFRWQRITGPPKPGAKPPKAAPKPGPMPGAPAAVE